MSVQNRIDANRSDTKQNAPTTASTRKTAALVGLLFLTATAAFIVANTLLTGVVHHPDFLTSAAAENTTLATGALFVFGQFGVVGIAVLLFPCYDATAKRWRSHTSDSALPNLRRACSTWRFRSWR